MSGLELAVSIHRFAPVPEGPCALILVGRDQLGPVALLLAVDRRYRPITMTPSAVVELAALAHQLAACTFLACQDAPDQLAAVAAVKLEIAAGRRWRVLAEPLLVGDQVAQVRGPSVDVLARAVGFAHDRGVAVLEQAVTP